jgi:glycerol-3-phosphate dehydrogenase
LINILKNVDYIYAGKISSITEQMDQTKHAVDLNREEFIDQLKSPYDQWDFIIAGGGATGLGIAVDAASRGYRTLLLEQSDFAKGTSSRSTKLVHGGVRYLQKGDVALVREALQERGYLARNAPHLVKSQRFIIGNYRWWERPFYTIGLTFYDLLSGSMSMGRSLPVSRKEVIRSIPGIVQEGLRGGVVYYDCQFDDSRLAINLMQTAIEYGATVLNYCRVSELTKDNKGKITGVIAEDMLDGSSFRLKGHCIINATGIFVDDLIRMDDPSAKPIVRPSQGTHLVVDRSFLGGDDAIMVPKTIDGRIMFGVPWHNRVILGTTDLPVKDFVLEPKALDEEIDFILETSGRYLIKKPQRKDVLCVFAGLRPLAAPKNDDGSSKTKEISRSHKLVVSRSRLVSITGGKWTTYRRMAEDTVNEAIKISGIQFRPCKTKNLHIHGFKQNPDLNDRLYVYGSDRDQLLSFLKEDPARENKLHPDYDLTVGEVIWAVRKEMARNVDDVLARRIRLLFLDAKASVKIAPRVAEIIADELRKDVEWQKKQVQEYSGIAEAYIIA